MQRGPGGQGLNLCLFLVKSDFLVGGSGVPWHFLRWGILFIWPKDSAKSHQPTATKHTGLRRKVARRDTTFSLFQRHLFPINVLLFTWLILDQNSRFCQPKRHLAINISARCPFKCFDMLLRGFWRKGQWHVVTIPPLLQRVTSPRQHTSHMDQWHNSCQGPSVLMSHMSQQFYLKLPPFSLPRFPSPLHPPRSLLPFMHSLSVPFNIHPPTSASLFIIFLTLTFLSVCLSVCLFVSLIILLHLTFSPSPPFLVLCPCGTYAGMGDPSWSRRGSCPLHVAWGWTFEESSGHLSLSPAFSLNTATDAVSAGPCRRDKREEKFIHATSANATLWSFTPCWVTPIPPKFSKSDQGMWVSYKRNGGAVLRLCSDACLRLISPDLLMELTTNQAVLEIKTPVVPILPFRAAIWGKSILQIRWFLIQATKAPEYFPHMLHHISTITTSTSFYECVAKTMVWGPGCWEIC